MHEPSYREQYIVRSEKNILILKKIFENSLKYFLEPTITHKSFIYSKINKSLLSTSYLELGNWMVTKIVKVLTLKKLNFELGQG